MKNKKILILFLVLLIVIGLIGFFALKKVKQKKTNLIQNEYTPEEEISEEQIQQTIVTLYFVDKESNQLKPEARLVNIKDVISNPYTTIIGLLINGPKNEKLAMIIPEDTQLLNATLDGDCLTLDFSDKFLNYNKEDEKVKDHLVYSIVNTLTELNEVNSIKFLINGESSSEFQEVYVRK